MELVWAGLLLPGLGSAMRTTEKCSSGKQWQSPDANKTLEIKDIKEQSDSEGQELAEASKTKTPKSKPRSKKQRKSSESNAVRNIAKNQCQSQLLKNLSKGTMIFLNDNRLSKKSEDLYLKSCQRKMSENMATCSFHTWGMEFSLVTWSLA